MDAQTRSLLTQVVAICRQVSTPADATYACMTLATDITRILKKETGPGFAAQAEEKDGTWTTMATGTRDHCNGYLTAALVYGSNRQWRVERLFDLKFTIGKDTAPVVAAPLEKRPPTLGSADVWHYRADISQDAACKEWGENEGVTDNPDHVNCPACRQAMPAETPAGDQARSIVDAIIADLSDRRGLGNEWEACDDDVRAEIAETWSRLVREGSS